MIIWVSMILFLIVSAAQAYRIHFVTHTSRDVSLVTWICATIAGLLMVVRGFINGDIEFVIAYGIPVVTYILVCIQIVYQRR